LLLTEVYKAILFLHFRTVPGWLSWFEKISWFYYSNEAMLTNQWKDYGKLDCGEVSFNKTNNKLYADSKDGSSDV